MNSKVEKQNISHAEPPVLFGVKNGVGIITLNRPSVLNALNLHMIREIDAKLSHWAKDGDIRAVIIQGAGDRAFCSGGDVKAVVQDGMAARAGKSDGQLTRDFFREEYTLNNRIFTFPKPYISLINGIVMGGGKGVSAHGAYRIVTENTLFAMPEANIGFFPDVGGGYFLPRCPGQTGVYLALTGKKIGALDTIYVGFATHFVKAERLADLFAALTGEVWNDRDLIENQIDHLLADFVSEPMGVSEIAPHRAEIDRAFGHDRVEDIFADLQSDKSAWAQQTLSLMYALSPTSLKLALRQLRLGKSMSFSEVMTMEYRLSQACLRGHDFYEGIRAALIDKDRKPKWDPARLEDVRDQDIEDSFKSTGMQDLIL